MLADTVKALTFDVFGTVVDWRSSIARECARVGEAKDISADWEAFADDWRAGYGPSMDRVRSGELPWTTIDKLHRMVLDELLEKFEITDLSEDEKDDLNRAWHRLDPWPDSVEGLARLRGKFVIATLSNGNVALLTNMAKRAGLPWDCIPVGRAGTSLQARPGVIPDGGGPPRTARRPGDDGRGTQGRPPRSQGRRLQDRVRAEAPRVRPQPGGRHRARPGLSTSSRRISWSWRTSSGRRGYLTRTGVC